jgi:cysteinyl-tRNA synthetase
MPLRLYNTLTRKKEIFKPVHDKNVHMYVCGPTVNDVPHLGHARQQISFDILRRYLTFLGYNVKFVSNITDIEDKIIGKANELGVSIKELSKKNEKEHMQDYKELGIEKPNVQPRATEYISQMIDLVKRLEKKGYTYTIEGDGVYYDISKFNNYGKLSHQKVENLKTGARVKAKNEKRNDGDFVLWKFSKKGEPSWDSPWGKGRPGWHIECSAMSYSILGLPLDIHGGGQDLIFPHHEDEIAQSEAGYGKKFSNYWMHNGMVNVDNVKMSKSLGNFTTVKYLLKEFSGEVIRYFVISAYYRKPIDFTRSGMEYAKNSYQRLKNIISSLSDDKKLNKKYLKEFEKAMNDDINTPRALQVLWKLVRDKKAIGKIQTIKKVDGVLGLDLLKKEKVEIPEEVRKLADERETARKNKNWKRSDELREKINKKGYVIEDTDKGWEIKRSEKSGSV